MIPSIVFGIFGRSIWVNGKVNLKTIIIRYSGVYDGVVVVRDGGICVLDTYKQSVWCRIESMIYRYFVVFLILMLKLRTQ